MAPLRASLRRADTRSAGVGRARRLAARLLLVAWRCPSRRCLHGYERKTTGRHPRPPPAIPWRMVTRSSRKNGRRGERRNQVTADTSRRHATTMAGPWRRNSTAMVGGSFLPALPSCSASHPYGGELAMAGTAAQHCRGPEPQRNAGNDSASPYRRGTPSGPTSPPSGFPIEQVGGVRHPPARALFCAAPHTLPPPPPLRIGQCQPHLRTPSPKATAPRRVARVRCSRAGPHARRSHRSRVPSSPKRMSDTSLSMYPFR